MPKEEIAEFVKAMGKPCITADSLRDAMAKAYMTDDEMKVVCGSLYLCGEIRKEIMLS